jgi:surface protein
MQKYQMNSKKYGGNPFKFTSLEGSRGRIGRGMWNVIQRRTEPLAITPAATSPTPTWTDGSLKNSNFTKAIDWWIEGGEYKAAIIFTLGTIDGWDTSAVTDMSSAFDNGRSRDVTLGGTLDSTTFNDDISGWRTNLVTNMAEMFNGAADFNRNTVTDGDIWKTSSVLDMREMFAGAVSFTGTGIDGWDVSSVTNMESMFQGATNFGVFDGGIYLDNWNVTNVTNMTNIFTGAVGLIGQNWSGTTKWKDAADTIVPISGFYSDGSNYTIGSHPSGSAGPNINTYVVI